ncbi:MAG: hypothetical protein ACRD1L_12260, partial [Terriglobales bacterium]
MKWQLLLTMAATLALALAGGGQAGSPATLKPAWRKLALNDSAPARKAGWWGETRSLTGLAFMEDGRLVAYEVIPVAPSLDGKNLPGSSW